ncbi:glycosyltransferase family 1 protein [Paenibacillus oralis]|uniref:Glycosyltransferase family 1 protein n=1 Tax=Paenibacillus oralis TaxID=2490856 RepID=A0A3P3U2H6_9BACL|nr:glycosyltransferase [Paenibacillus oralis]RRJ64264.1 glycosyltransferase family 1 protein [Paenibacillus oralis]
MKVLRAYETGQGQAEWITNGLRDRELQVDVYNWGQQSLQQFNPSDILHIHGSLAAYAALPELSTYLENSQVVPLIHYETKEIRTRDEAVRTNFYAHLDESYDEGAVDRLEQWSVLFPACIVENEEAFQYASKYHERVYIVPYAIDPEEFSGAPGTSKESSSDPVLIVHLGADVSSGGEFVEKAVSLLHQQGYSIRYENAQNLSRSDAARLMSEADIVIDQLLHGSYGMASVEAMALRKPVLSHLREDLIPAMDPELPVVSANPATLYRKLIPLIESQELRNKLGQAGKDYAAKNHYLDAVIPKILDVYRQELQLGQRQVRPIAADPIPAAADPGGRQKAPSPINVRPTSVPRIAAPVNAAPVHAIPLRQAAEAIPPSNPAPLIHVPEPPISNDPSGKQQQQETAVNQGNMNSNKNPGTSQDSARGLPKSARKVKRLSGTMKTRTIYPKQFKSVNRTGTKSASYVYFDLSGLPKSAMIKKAIMKLPVRLQRKERVSIQRIIGNWNANLAIPSVYSKRLFLLSGPKSHWKCTKWVRRWHRRPDKNFGIYTSKKLTRTPKLLIKYKSK